MTTIPTFSREVIDMGFDAYKNTRVNRNFIHAVTGHTQGAIVQFLNNPWDDPAHDWVLMREIRAFDGLRSGDEMPSGLKTFPSVDRREIVSPQTGKPAMETVRDPLLDLIKPGRYDSGPVHKPSTILVVNAIYIEGQLTNEGKYDPDPGTHIVLKFSHRIGNILEDKFFERRSENAQFDATKFAWRLTFTGTGQNSGLAVDKLTDRDIVPMDGIQPFDLPDLFGQIRADAEAHIASLDPGAASVLAPEPFIDRSQDDAAMDLVEAGIAALQAGGIEGTRELPGQFFEGMSDASLRRRLTEASVKVPRGANRSVLLALAEANLTDDVAPF